MATLNSDKTGVEVRGKTYLFKEPVLGLHLKVNEWNRRMSETFGDMLDLEISEDSAMIQKFGEMFKEFIGLVIVSPDDGLLFENLTWQDVRDIRFFFLVCSVSPRGQVGQLMTSETSNQTKSESSPTSP